MSCPERQKSVSRALLKAHNEARDRHQSEYQYYASSLPELYLSRREQFGRTFYGELGIQPADLVAIKNYKFSALRSD
jgi:hypothetical protein